MNYLIDFNGVINRHPEKFLDMCKALKSNGNTIYICTGKPRKETYEELKRLGFVDTEKFHTGEIINMRAYFTCIISLTDYVKKKVPEHEIEYDFNGNVWVDGTLWWKLRGQVCKEYKIDVFIDDSDEYFPYIPNNILKMLVPSKF